jgi:hypothetical protein
MKSSKLSPHICAAFSTSLLTACLSLFASTTFAQTVDNRVITPLSTTDVAVDVKSVAKKPAKNNATVKSKEARLIGPKSDLASTGINKPTPPTPPKDELLGRVKKPAAPLGNKKLVTPRSSVDDRATGINKPTPPTPPKDELKPMLQ